MARPGRRMLREHLPRLRHEHDAIIVNCENAAGGKGVTPDIVAEILDLGADALTSGNHIWANRDVFAIIDEEPRLLRPANFPAGEQIPGRGAGVFTLANGTKLGVANLLGRVFMKPIDCPFRVGRAVVERLRAETPLVVVDMHAEATSEKRALACMLDGAATAVIGTHTHVQTADDTVLPGGTAYISDAGMTGPHDSIVGVKSDIILHNFLTGMPVRHEAATGDARIEGVAIEADSQTGKALKIARLRIRERA